MVTPTNMRDWWVPPPLTHVLVVGCERTVCYEGVVSVVVVVEQLAHLWEVYYVYYECWSVGCMAEANGRLR
jgi:hypothetical protein